MSKDFFDEKRPHDGLTYSDFMDYAEKQVENVDESSMDDKEKELLEYTKLNLHRSKRIDKTYEVSDELKSKIESIDSEQIWMVITEPWCGDSAQNLPYMAKFAEVNPKIKLRVILRDKNLDIMDQYLTNGTARSIPKLVVFDSEGNELFLWGPRPAELVEQIEVWKKEMEPKEWKEKLHLWYGRNRGKAIEKEFLELL